MKIIYNNIIPFRGFVAMLTIFILWVRKEYKGDKRLDAQFFNHEKIHSYQQIEIWVTSIVVIFFACLLTELSFWWILATPALPILIYVACWLVEIALPPYDSAYRNICFESEAIYNEANPDYLKRRGLFTFKFLKYISNKKYPYIPHSERGKLNNYDRVFKNR